MVPKAKLDNKSDRIASTGGLSGNGSQHAAAWVRIFVQNAWLTNLRKWNTKFQHCVQINTSTKRTMCGQRWWVG